MDKYYKVYDTEKHEYHHGKRVFMSVADNLRCLLED